MNQRNDFLPCTSMNITNSFRLFLLSISIFGLSAACATLPRVSETIDEVPAGRKPRQLVSAKGLLSPETSRAIMERLKRSVEPTDLLDRQICVMESVSQSPLTKGNKVTLLVDGPATYAAMFKAIQNARGLFLQQQVSKFAPGLVILEDVAFKVDIDAGVQVN